MSGIAARRASALLLLMMMMMMLAACGGLPKKPSPPPLAKTGQASVPPASPGSPRKVSPYAPAQEDPEKRGDYTRGGLYAPHIADSAPTAPIDVDAIPEPDVVDEPLAKYGNRSPYTVIGKSYRVRDTAKGYNETGTASYYGNKFHGRRTSNQEVYDMYAFTAAHRTLPLPSFARVTHLDSGKSVVVRVNDRGPFHDGRLIDLSYAAAVKLGIHPRGTGRVEVVGLSPGERPLPSAARQDAATSARAANASHTPPASLASHTIANGALTLPPGVRIATGKPQPMPPTAIDRLVHALPIATAAAAERDPAPQASPPRAEPLPASAAAALATAATATAATAATAPGSDLDWRFDMRRDGHAMTADQFDAWMTSRRARVATGKAGPPDPYGSASPQTRRARAAPTKAAPQTPAAETLIAAREADAPKALPPSAAIADGVTLQVAAFGARANAERALSMLKDAGVAEVRMLDGVAAGKPVWRVRVGPVEGARVAELTTRVAGLGFGQPQVVRE